ncbi:MAG: YlbF family regulator [Clostridiales Family XIII bacterium]|jgi:cell fate (sporulation/competence/biofilm development) regulator YlbF (YheA/YmcA/DUF963 family)|nr:YlbF family regulator [Clostridiales Family XIII bacterium]
MENIHDMARELAEAIRRSEVYTSYIEAKNKASENPELTDALNDFREKQYDLQRKQMLGEELGPEVLSQMQSLGQILMRDPVAAAFLQAEVRFTLLVNDVYAILGEALKTE